MTKSSLDAGPLLSLGRLHNAAKSAVTLTLVTVSENQINHIYNHQGNLHRNRTFWQQQGNGLTWEKFRWAGQSISRHGNGLRVSFQSSDCGGLLSAIVEGELWTPGSAGLSLWLHSSSPQLRFQRFSWVYTETSVRWVAEWRFDKN